MRSLTPAGLAGEIAAAALRRRLGQHPVRVGIDGPVEADAGRLADDVAAALRSDAVPVARVRARDFLRPRSLRLEHGPDDPDDFRAGWYDQGALRRELLDPLGPGGSGRWLRRLRDPQTDRSVRSTAQPTVSGLVLVLDGRFLAAPALRPGIDLLVLLAVSPAARARRVPPDEANRVLPAWTDYLDAERPDRTADLVVRYDHPERPAVQDRDPIS